MVTSATAGDAGVGVLAFVKRTLGATAVNPVVVLAASGDCLLTFKPKAFFVGVSLLGRPLMPPCKALRDAARLAGLTLVGLDDKSGSSALGGEETTKLSKAEISSDDLVRFADGADVFGFPMPFRARLLSAEEIALPVD